MTIRRQFNLRTLMTVVAMCAGLVFLWLNLPRAAAIAAFIVAVIAVAVTTTLAVRAAFSRGRLSLRIAMACTAAWLGLYATSLGPARIVAEPRGFGRETAKAFYAPLLWIDQSIPKYRPFDRYSDHWRSLSR